MEHELRINAALGKILRYFNYLELNLGLCLRSLENPGSPENSHSYLNRAGLPQTIERLTKLLDKCEHVPDTSEFRDWAKRAEESRLLRNYYAHATWEYLPLRNEAPLGFSIPPWRKGTIKGDYQGTMRIEDLEEDACRIETAFNEFMKIRKKLGI